MPDYILAEFNTAGGTVAATVERGTNSTPESPLSVWLRSEGARAYEGRWVLLDPALTVLDTDLSPTALRERHPNLPADSAIVFVPVTMVRLGA
jgi:hypothetical protein